MKLTRIDLDSGFGCVFSPLHPTDLKKMAELGGPSPPGKYPEPHLGEIALGVTVDIGNRPSPVGSETT
jgi:hypothetical protein